MNSIILVDDQSITNFITRKLLEIEGVEIPVEDFTNPIEALAHVNENEEMFILLDLNMPEMSGWEFLEHLNTNKFPPKVVILTSSTSELDQERAKKYSFVLDYLIKPLKQQVVAELLRKYCLVNK